MLEWRQRAGGDWYCLLVECPACGQPFTDGDPRAAHIATHTPADFGL